MKHTDRVQITASGYLDTGGKAIIAILTLTECPNSHPDQAQATASGYLERGGKAVIAILTLAVAMSGFQSCGQVQQPLPPNNGPPCFFFFFFGHQMHHQHSVSLSGPSKRKEGK